MISKRSKHPQAVTNSIATSTGSSACDDPRVEAARKRLRESSGQADALEAVREIVTNLLGCEEIGIFTVCHEHRHAQSELLWSFGIDTERYGTLNAFDQALVHRVMQGEMHVTLLDRAGDEKRDHPPLRVFVPIRSNEKTVAILVMLTLLPQKVSFDQSDINLVKLLSAEAGKALFDRSVNANA